MMGTKAQYDHIERYIRRWSPTWEKRFGLTHWKIDHAFLDSYSGLEEDTDDFMISACTESRWQYLEAKIKWYLPSVARHDDEKLHDILVHELVHVLLSAEQNAVFEVVGPDPKDHDGTAAEKLAYNTAVKSIELSTETVTRAFLSAWAVE